MIEEYPETPDDICISMYVLYVLVQGGPDGG
jgi:hypothetical protein